MLVVKGKSVYKGVAIGKIYLYQRKEAQVTCAKITDVEAEWKRYVHAKEEAVMQLQELCDRAQKQVGEQEAAIFEAHQMMLDDEDYAESVEHIIREQQVNAEYAVAETSEIFQQMFRDMDNEYMQSRAADIKDISERLIFILQRKGRQVADLKEPAIIIADDLSPSETVQFDKDKVLSFVMTKGSANAHTSILARTMGIPSLIHTEWVMDDSFQGKLGIVDGEEGVLYLEPTQEVLECMKERQRKELEEKQQLQSLIGKEDITIDGQKVMLYANIGSCEDLTAVLQNDARGIGLFRSEFLYLEKAAFPTEEEQFEVYRQVAEAMSEKMVIIRTLDIGADKQCDYFELQKEENPALGCRAIRICLNRPDVFKTQLRALFRASSYGNLAIMYPMITSLWEVQRIKEIVEEVKCELASQGAAFGTPKQGIMIETPAAALISDILAKEVDFFSIGTNDLTQYTLAVDRQNSALEPFYDAHHKAVLRMIQMVVQNAHQAGIWAGICGELAADLSLTREFLAMGVDELSVSPGCILPLRQLVIQTNVREYKSGE